MTEVHKAIFGDPSDRDKPGMLENVRAMRTAFDVQTEKLMFYVRLAIGVSVLALSINNPITAHYVKTWLH